MTTHPVRGIGCEEALRRLADYLDHELGGEPADELKRHLDACRSCFSRAEFERRLKARLRELGHHPVAGQFEERICEMARGFTAS